MYVFRKGTTPHPEHVVALRFVIQRVIAMLLFFEGSVSRSVSLRK